GSERWSIFDVVSFACRNGAQRAFRTSVAAQHLVPLLMALLVIVAAATDAGAQLLRVAPVGVNAAGCGTAANPCRTIQFAVDQISSAGTILVAGSPSGTRYTYDAATESCLGPFGMTGIVCIVNKEVTIRGGFSTSNWTSPSPTANLTIIDGQNSSRGFL